MSRNTKIVYSNSHSHAHVYSLDSRVEVDAAKPRCVAYLIRLRFGIAHWRGAEGLYVTVLIQEKNNSVEAQCI